MLKRKILNDLISWKNTKDKECFIWHSFLPYIPSKKFCRKNCTIFATNSQLYLENKQIKTTSRGVKTLGLFYACLDLQFLTKHFEHLGLSQQISK